MTGILILHFLDEIHNGNDVTKSHLCGNVKTLKRYLRNYPHLSDYGQTIFVFLFRRGTEQPHQGDMNNSTSPNMFLINKNYEDAIRSD